MKKYDVVIIGGGASGAFAAANLAEAGLGVAIIEPNRELCRKLRITGKGRCNLTNNCTPEEVLKNIPRNPKFLFSALNRFPPEKIMSWFESRGVPLKTERGRRVFPVSDNADDVAEAIIAELDRFGVEIFRDKAEKIILENGAAVGVKTRSEALYADFVMLSTGGKSYPKTGSDGSGYALCRECGHTVTETRPSLVPIETEEDFCAALSGLTLKNVTLSLYDLSKSKKPLMSELGELTFMPYGVGGPLAISASCYIDTCKGYNLVIDLKPALSREQLDLRLQREIKESPRKTLGEMLRGLLPKELSELAAELLSLDKSQFSSNLTREQRYAIIDFLKGFSLTPKALRPFDEAIITRGGVSVKEISPSTMESKLVKNLYFTGEIIDCDAFTGGYNLTIAFSTAYSAAYDIINRKRKFDNGT